MIHPDLIIKIIAYFEQSANPSEELDPKTIPELLARRKIHFVVEGSQADLDMWNEYIDGERVGHSEATLRQSMLNS
jgi:hypothetical protein